VTGEDLARLATSFDADVENYARSRPPYPPALFERLASVGGITRGTRVLEIGPGTGLATLPVLDLGAEIVAVEPGTNMASYLRRLVAGRPCRVVESRFEDAELYGAFEVAIAGTSFHWIDPVAGIRKLSTLLAPGARLALFWNVHGDPDDRDVEWTQAMAPIARRVGNEHPPEPPAPLDRDARVAEIVAGGWFELSVHEVFRWSFTHDASSMRALFASFSSWSTLPDLERANALDDIARLVDDQFGGCVTRTYTTALYVARRV
jgi:SAM-dependent methyltransferase